MPVLAGGPSWHRSLRNAARRSCAVLKIAS